MVCPTCSQPPPLPRCRRFAGHSFPPPPNRVRDLASGSGPVPNLLWSLFLRFPLMGIPTHSLLSFSNFLLILIASPFRDAAPFALRAHSQFCFCIVSLWLVAAMLLFARPWVLVKLSWPHLTSLVRTSSVIHEVSCPSFSCRR